MGSTFDEYPFDRGTPAEGLVRSGEQSALSRQLWRGLRDLQARIVAAMDRDDVLDEALDVVIDSLGADRGLVYFGTTATGVQVVAARRAGRGLTPLEMAEVSQIAVDDAMSRDACIEWRPTDRGRESMTELGIGMALAAPLRWGDTDNGDRAQMGAVYVDFRAPFLPPAELPMQFLDSASALIAGVVEQRERRQSFRDWDQRVHEIHPVEEVSGPSLEELLRPPSMVELRQDVRAATVGNSNVILLGESGTGKTRLAELVAAASGRSPIVRAVLGQSDDLNTITSELFGHERGAFSGASGKRKGLVEYADGGTLILDEILNLPPHAQQLLLDFTQFGHYRPLGYQGREPKRARVRLIAATNGDLAAAMREGRFRQDLWFRLAAVPIRLPPLRERREDIPLLAESYLRRLDRGRLWRLTVPARRLLLSDELSWDGNIRELEGVMQLARDRALAESPASTNIRPEHIRARDLGRLDLRIPEPADYAPPPVAREFQVEPDELDDSWARLQRERKALDEIETRIIEMALKRHRGIVSHAAKELAVSRTSLISRMTTLGIDLEKFRRVRL
jgi:DNA-binding NtrC family response regulator